MRFDTYSDPYLFAPLSMRTNSRFARPNPLFGKHGAGTRRPESGGSPRHRSGWRVGVSALLAGEAECAGRTLQQFHVGFNPEPGDAAGLSDRQSEFEQAGGFSVAAVDRSRLGRRYRGCGGGAG